MTKRDDGGHICGLKGYTPWIDPPCPGCLRVNDTGTITITKYQGSEEPMTKPDPITLPCVCHVPPPEGTVRLELRLPRIGELYWEVESRCWSKASIDFKNNVFPVAILAPQYDYPTPVEACRLLADAGGPIECEFTDEDEWPLSPVHGRLAGIKMVKGGELWFVNGDSGFAWRKIRIPKRG